MIPKTIHYCWFGKGKYSPIIEKCIASWKRVLPEYEIVLWNEDNFDVNSNSFAKEAYEVRKFAFVSDYARLWILLNHGGIYMDTDVEVLKPLDPFLKHAMFSGFESPTAIPTGIMAAEAGHPWIREQLDYYSGRHFILPSGEYDTTTNVTIMTKSAVEHGLRLNNQYQQLDNGCVFYPSDFFCPSDHDMRITLTPNTQTIHHFAGSWLPPQNIRYKNRRRLIIRLLGVRLADILTRIYSRIISLIKH